MRKFRKMSMILSLLLVLSSFSMAFGANTIPQIQNRTNDRSNIVSTTTDENVRVIIEIEGTPVIDRAIAQGVKLNSLEAKLLKTEIQSLEAKQEIVKSKMDLSGIEAEYRHTYTRVYNGFSADVKYSEIENIKNIANVKEVHIARKYALPEPDMNTSGGLVYAPETWALNYTGEGMLVAVLDTGIDASHADLKLDTGITPKYQSTDIAKLIAIEDFAAEDFSNNLVSQGGDPIDFSQVYQSLKVPYGFDYADIDTVVKADTSKPNASMHGMHVSGTVAANGSIKGIAPNAQIASMKVFSDDDEYAYEDDIVAGIEDAILLDADAINMSLGSTAGFTDDDEPEQEAVNRAKAYGIVVAVSAGNSGHFGEGNADGLPPLAWNPDTALLGSPSAGTNTFSVASMENSMAMLPYMASSNGTKMNFSAAGSLDPVDIFVGPIQYEYCGLGDTADFEGVNLTGKIALIKRGDIAFVDKIMNAQNNGAIGVIVFNHETGGDAMVSMQYPGEGTIPAVFLGNTNGDILNNATVKTVEFNESFVDSFANPGALEMSDFTSWGPTPSLEFKPEITAPGGDIYSLLNDDKYGSMSGTSMAAPHIAGGAALVLEYIDENISSLSGLERGRLAKQLMMSTAVPVESPNGVDYSPRRQGAGLMELQAAVTTDVYAIGDPNESKVSLREIDDEVFSFDVELNSLGDEDHEFIISANAITDGQLQTYFNSTEPVEITGAKITVSGNDVRLASTTSGAVVVTSSSAVTVGNLSTTNIIDAEDLIQTEGENVAVVKVASGSSTVVTFNVDLSDSITGKQFSNGMFDNGMFVEGFVRFINTDEGAYNPTVGIPYMGFYGDWADLPILDEDIFNIGMSYFGMQGPVTVKTIENGYDASYLGVNEVSDEVDKSYIAISPNGDNYNDNIAGLLSFIRNSKSLNVQLLDSNHQSLGYITLNEIFNVRKHFESNGIFTPYYFPANEYEPLVWDGKLEGEVVADGQYYYAIEVTADYPGASAQIIEYPVFVDTTIPVLSGVSRTGSNVVISATDNHQIMSYEIYDPNGTLVKESVSNTIDISNLQPYLITVKARDYAGNLSVGTLFDLDNSKDNNPSTGGSSGGSTGGGFGGGVSAPSTSEQPSPSTPVKEKVAELDAGSVTEELKNGVAEISVNEEALIKAASGAVTGEKPVVVIKLSEQAQSSTTQRVNLTGAAIKGLVQKGAAVKIVGNGVEFKLDSSFSDVSGDVQITMSRGVKPNYKLQEGQESLDMAFDFDITADGKKIEGFNVKPEIKLDLPKTITSPEFVSAYVQNEDGTWEQIMSYYDKATGTLRFKAPHFSTYALMKYSKTFDDIKTHWAKNNIEIMASKQITTGVTDVLFAPDRAITRAEFAIMALKTTGEFGQGSGTFNDVASDKWYAGYLGKAKALELISADSKGNFRPDDNITREEMAVIIAKTHAYINNLTITSNIKNITFSDAAKVSGAATDYVNYVESKGIISGYPDETFRPGNSATRAEALTMLKVMLDK